MTYSIEIQERRKTMSLDITSGLDMLLAIAQDLFNSLSVVAWVIGGFIVAIGLIGWLTGAFGKIFRNAG
jgi:hypothetical protein